MRFDEINWFDVDSYLKGDDRIMLVIGSCEQHGYLSLMTDVKIPIAVADAVSQRTGVLVGPPVNFGASPYFLAYPGTISLRIATLMDVVEDMIRSLFTQGFRRFLFLNGHGGNEPIRGRLFELINETLFLMWLKQANPEYLIRVRYDQRYLGFQFGTVVELNSPDFS